MGGRGKKYQHLEEEGGQEGGSFEPLEIDNAKLVPPEENKPSAEVHSDGTPAGAGSTDLCYICYFALGTGILFPWNAFITAVDFFQLLFPGKHVDRTFSVAYMIPNLLILGLLLAIPSSSSSSYLSKRVYTAFVLYLICLLAIPVIDMALESGVEPEKCWEVIVTVVVVAGTADGIGQGSLFGSASHMPPKYTQAIVSGTSVSGVVISLLRIVTKLVAGGDDKGSGSQRSSSYVYFGVAAAFCFACIIVQSLLPRLAVRKHYDGILQDQKQQLSRNESAVRGLQEGGQKGPSIWALFVSIWPLAIGLFSTYAVTLSIFPGFLAEDVESKALGDWLSIGLITLFNIFDFAGKSLPVYEAFRIHKPMKLFVLSLVRLLFYPMYAFAVLGPVGVVKKDPLGPIYLSVITIALGFSNGILTSNCIMEAPGQVSLPNAERTEMLIIWFLLLGLLVGALLGWIWLIL